MNTVLALRRPYEQRVIAGVCAALGRSFGIDPVLLRLAWIVFTFIGGSGVLLYLLAWWLIPDEQGQRAWAPFILLLAFFVLVPLLCAMIGVSTVLFEWLL